MGCQIQTGGATVAADAKTLACVVTQHNSLAADFVILQNKVSCLQARVVALEAALEAAEIEIPEVEVTLDSEGNEVDCNDFS